MTRNEWEKKFYGMPNSKKYRKIFKDTNLLAQVELYYVNYINNVSNNSDQYFIEQMEDFVNRSREVRFKMNTTPAFKTQYYDDCAKVRGETKAIWLGNCEAATPILAKVAGGNTEYVWPVEKQGNNPMRIENTTATAYITSEKSSEAVSREYLLSRLQTFESWKDTKVNDIRKLFNMDAPEYPQTYQELIDAIKNDKFKLDDKRIRRLEGLKEDRDLDDDELQEYGYGPFYALIFTDLPKADRKGFDASLLEWAKQKQAAKDIIMTSSPADGLAALQALGAWLPAGKAS